MTKSAVKEREPSLLDPQQAPAAKLPAKADHKAPAKPTAASLGEALLAASSDPKVDAEKCRYLWELHKDVAAEEARLAYLRDFFAMADELPTIDRNGEIVIEGKGGKRGQRTPYVRYEDLHDVLKPILKAHNFIMQHATEANADPSRLNCISFLRHTQGHEVRSVFPLPAETTGSKNNVQAWGSTNSYGKKYNTINLLNMNSRAPQDADKNGAAPQDEPPKLSAEQVNQLTKAIEFCGVGEARFLEKFKIEAVTDLPPEQFNEALKACKDYAAKTAANAKPKAE